MKYTMWLLAGLAVCMLCSCAVYAAGNDAVLESEKMKLQGQGGNPVVPVQYAGASGPVTSLPGYSQWDIYWSTSSFTRIWSGDEAQTNSITYYAGRTEYDFKPGTSLAWILIPFANTITHSGAHPMTRWVYVLMNPGGNQIRAVHAYNEDTDKRYIDLSSTPITGSTTTLYYFDLGSYYEFDRGLTIVLSVYNPDTAAHTTKIYGGGQKAEW